MARRERKVTKADLDRVAEFMRVLGLKTASIDVLPDRVRVVTSEGTLSVPSEEADLDAEQAEFRKRNGYR